MKTAVFRAKQLARHRALQREWLSILRRHPEANPDNVWNTLQMLELPPTERLRHGLLRGEAYRRMEKRR
jgi:hypothetical protein